MARQKEYKNLKLQEKYAMYFTEARQCKEVESRTSKYRVFEGKDAKGEIFYFLGKSGSVRFNRKNAVTDSVSLTASKAFNLNFMTWEESKTK